MHKRTRTATSRAVDFGIAARRMPSQTNKNRAIRSIVVIGIRFEEIGDVLANGIVVDGSSVSLKKTLMNNLRSGTTNKP